MARQRKIILIGTGSCSTHLLNSPRCSAGCARKWISGPGPPAEKKNGEWKNRSSSVRGMNGCFGRWRGTRKPGPCEPTGPVAKPARPSSHPARCRDPAAGGRAPRFAPPVKSRHAREKWELKEKKRQAAGPFHCSRNARPQKALVGRAQSGPTLLPARGTTLTLREGRE